MQQSKGYKWEDEARKVWKEYFEELYNIDTHTQEEAAVHMCGFEGIRRGNYFGGEMRLS